MEWENYDDSILTNHIKNVGCRAPYQKAVDGVKLCSTKESMRNASLLRPRNEHMLITPCKYMAKILYGFEESDMSETKYYKKGHVQIGIFFWEDSFRETVQTRFVCV